MKPRDIVAILLALFLFGFLTFTGVVRIMGGNVEAGAAAELWKTLLSAIVGGLIGYIGGSQHPAPPEEK